MDRPVIIHIHVPKTAGTTINAMISQAVPGVHFAYSNPGQSERFAAMSQQERDEIDFVFGHFSYGLHTFFTRNTVYVASLREPVERILSAYKYIRATESHPKHAFLRQCAPDFAAFLRYAVEDENIRAEVDNEQVRQISGEMDLSESYDDIFHKALSNISVPNFICAESDNLELMLGVVSERLGLKFGAVPRLNVSAEQINSRNLLAALPDESFQVLQQFTRWDYDLWQAATQQAA